MTHSSTGFGAALLVACAAAMPASAGSAQVTIRSDVPVTCEASVVGHTVIPGDNLIIDVRVRRACNTTHRLKVTYDPQNVTDPNDLEWVFEGVAPTTSALGQVVFDNRPYANSIEPLHIVYTGASVAQGQGLITTIAIAVSAM